MKEKLRKWLGITALEEKQAGAIASKSEARRLLTAIDEEQQHKYNALNKRVSRLEQGKPKKGK